MTPRSFVLLAYDKPQEASPQQNTAPPASTSAAATWRPPQAGKLIAQILDYMGVEKQVQPGGVRGGECEHPQAVGYSVADAAARLEKKG